MKKEMTAQFVESKNLAQTNLSQATKIQPTLFTTLSERELFSITAHTQLNTDLNKTCLRNFV